MPIRTHYDNLKVSKNAPPEVIKAAYKALAHKFHPDRNPSRAEDCAKIMAIINQSYEVLSNPSLRKKHDEWIARQGDQAHLDRATTQNAEAADKPLKQKNKPKLLAIKLIGILMGNWLVLICLVGLGFVILDQIESKSRPKPNSYNSNVQAKNEHDFSNAVNPFDKFDEPVRKVYTRPLQAPNGEAWPNTADYIDGYSILNASGLSTVTIDNTQNSSDVFVKLFYLSGASPYAVRLIYLPAHSKRTLNKVTAGLYDVRYQDLTDGSLARSESFELQEIKTYDGTQFSNITMTLYKVQNGNMQTYSLPESEF